MANIVPEIPVLPNRSRQVAEFAYEVHPFDGQVKVPNVKRPVEYTLAIPENPTTDVIAVGVNGFAATKPAFRWFMTALSRKYGVPSLHFDPARVVGSRLDPRRTLIDPQQLHYDTLEAIATDLEINLGIAKLPNGRETRAAKLAILGHSMGDISGSTFAKDNPSKVDAVVHMGGVGLEGASGMKLLPRTLSVLAKDVVPNALSGRFGHNPRDIGRSIHYFIENPLQTIGEMGSCFTTDLRQTVSGIRDNGTYQAFVGFDKDQYFDPYDTLREIGDVVDYWAVLSESRHTAPQSRPYFTAKNIGQILVERPLRV